MRRAVRGVALLALLLAAAPGFAATAREMYASALARQKALAESSQESRASQKPRYRAAIVAFEAVVRRHPTSSYADNALWEGARVALDAHNKFGDDGDAATAARLLGWLIEQYPSSRLVPGARETLKQVTARPAATAPVAPAGRAQSEAGGARVSPAASKDPAVSGPGKAGGAGGSPAASKDTAVNSPSKAGAAGGSPATSATEAAEVQPSASGPTVLRDIRRTVVGDTVRVTIQLDAEVVYRSERVENPARVLFDLSSTRLGPAVGEGSITFSGDIVRHLRIGRHPNQVTRVVLDLEGVKQYSVFTLYSPYRIVVDCERDRAAAVPLPKTRIAEERISLPPPEPEVVEPPPPPPLLTGHASRAKAPIAPAVSMPAPIRTPAPVPVALVAPPLLRPTRTMAPTRRFLAWQPSIVMPLSITPAPAASTAPAATAFTATPEHVEKGTTPSRPMATPPNGFSLARQLGLGASRIVIDPGHGGHDPGAEGSGVYESTIVLDVALRLEKLLVGSGSEVVLTRRTDEYIPLEERTSIANRAQGDLFLSIHANASRNRAARGVESYFLNFATNPEAEAVAARENAATDRTMSNLTDIVKAIALNNKLDESKSFAGLVQRQLVDHLKGSNSGVRNHGVKQAPFVVLIGASMPSVLVEISFITNSQEGRLLKSAAYRQKIAEALFDAVRGYQKSLKGATAVTNQ